LRSITACAAASAFAKGEISFTIGDFLVEGPEVPKEDVIGRRVDVPCEVGPDMGAPPPLLLEVDVVILDDVDRFRALCGLSDSLGVGSCSLSNLPIAGFCTTYKKFPFSYRPLSGRTTVPDAAR